MLTLLIFIPVLMLIVLANLGEAYAWARWLTYSALLILTLLLILMGFIAMLVLPSTSMTLPAGFAPNWRVFGLILIITNILGLIAAGIGSVAGLAEREWRWGHLRWNHPVHVTGVVLTLLLVGGTLAQTFMISNPALLSKSGMTIGIEDLTGQAIGLVFLAILGVGFGIRRNWPETATRLGLTHFKLEDLTVAVLGVIGLVVLSIPIELAITYFFPASSSQIEAFDKLLLGSFQSVGGAFLLGLLSGVSEELLYRGALQPVFGLWVTSLIFAFSHMQYVLSPAILLVFVLGLVLGWIRNRWNTGTAMLVHAGYNTVLVLLSLFASNLLGP